MAKVRKCPLCGDNLIKIASSYRSCPNKGCDNYFNYHEFDRVYIDHYILKDKVKQDFSQIDNIDEYYAEDYDEYLFFSNHPNYITRYEYRQSNNFIEDYLFKNYKRSKFDYYISDDEISHYDNILYKYKLMEKGRNLENISSREAFEYYKSIKNNSLFRNDYYIYKKMVKLASDFETQMDLIFKFFKSGIYCNRYHYLWFLNKLNKVSKNIEVFSESIDEALYNFKNSGFNNKVAEDSPIVLAEKITSQYGKIKVLTDKQYVLKQFRYELQEEISHLYYCNQFEYIIEIYKKLILDYNSKSVKLYQGLCTNYHRIKDYESEIKWIYRYINSSSRYNSDKTWCNDRLNKLDVITNSFNHNLLFFDTFEDYLNESDFEKNHLHDIEMEDYLNSVKAKYDLVEEGLSLERDPFKAIEYYNSLLGDDLFKNDYYLFKSLVILYDQIGDYENELETIISFFESGNYCDRFNYLFFLYHFNMLYSRGMISYEDVSYYLEYFKNNGFKNQYLENNPVPIAERIICDKKEINIVHGDDFSNNQFRSSTDLEIKLFNGYSMFNRSINICKLLIDKYNNYPTKIYKRLCMNYRKIKDYENELKTIDKFIDEDNPVGYTTKKWFIERKKKLVKLMDKKPNSQILKDPEIEIFFENNLNYLTFSDFKENELKNTELLDKIREKYDIKRQGLKLEHNYEKAIDFYNSFLESELFKNDYYIYRRLVLVYSYFGEYELVHKTIKDFFNSGIYCNRYQYLWFLHKLIYVSKVKFISDEEIMGMLYSFKYGGFRNTNFKDNLEIVTERFKKSKTSILINSATQFDNNQKEYGSKEEITQLELNGNRDKVPKILKKLIEDRDFTPAKEYMRLCHIYRENGDYESEKALIKEYLAKNKYSKEWFENRLKELEKLMN